jgi:hypothetical protein
MAKAICADARGSTDDKVRELAPAAEAHVDTLAPSA